MDKSNRTTPVVLVADDEPSMLALVARHVRTLGYEVVEAADGEAAWGQATKHLPDLVLLDVMMPAMSGWEVCRRIRENVALVHTGVIMLTGIGQSLNELTSPLYGADAYIDKPFEFKELDDKIRDVLMSRGHAVIEPPPPSVGDMDSVPPGDDMEATQPRKAPDASSGASPATSPERSPMSQGSCSCGQEHASRATKSKRGSAGVVGHLDEDGFYEAVTLRPPRLSPGAARQLKRTEAALAAARTGSTPAGKARRAAASPTRGASRATGSAAQGKSAAKATGTGKGSAKKAPAKMGNKAEKKATDRRADKATRKGTPSGKPGSSKKRAKKPASKKPAAKKASVRKPVAKKPSANKPVVKKPSANKPVGKHAARGRAHTAGRRPRAARPSARGRSTGSK